MKHMGSKYHRVNALEVTFAPQVRNIELLSPHTRLKVPRKQLEIYVSAATTANKDQSSKGRASRDTTALTWVWTLLTSITFAKQATTV